MTRKLLVLLFPLLLIVFTTSANAQTAVTDTTPTVPANTQTATNAATKLRQQKQLLQDQKRAAFSKAKEEAKTLFQTRKEEFKIKLQAIKDQKKKVLAERIDAKLAEVNAKHTEKFLEILERLQGFLDKIKQSTTNTTVLADVAAAQTAIDTARTAVEAQALKTYVMTIADDATLKLNAGTTVKQLRLDLSAAHKLVVDAKQAVHKLNTDKTIIKKEATRSAEL